MVVWLLRVEILKLENSKFSTVLVSWILELILFFWPFSLTVTNGSGETLPVSRLVFLDFCMLKIIKKIIRRKIKSWDGKSLEQYFLLDLLYV